MPTGRTLLDARGVLLDAGRRVLAEHGAGALTSRSVTEASGVAKGVLHRHFEDFDAFLAALVTEEGSRIRAVEPLAMTSAQVAVADVIEQIFTPTMIGLVAIVITRGDVRERLATDGGGLPLLGDAAAVVADVLAAAREVGWIRTDADIAALALALVGSMHLLTVGADGVLPDHANIHDVVTALLGASLSQR